MTGPQTDTQLWMRPLNSLEARLLPLATNSWHVTWSPDMQSIVYASTGQLGLRRMDLAGGPVRTLTEDATERSAWSRDGVIVFTPRTAPQRLMRVPSTGGPATPATELNVAAGEVAHYWPAFLPDGKRFIFLARNQDPSKSALFLASLDSTERTHLLDVHSMAEVVPGFLLYQREGTVYAHPFDESSARFTGDPVPIIENVQFNRTNGRAAFVTSSAGHLVYRTGESLSDGATLSWLDRTGKVVGTIGQPGGYTSGAMSPDNRRYVVGDVDKTGGRDLVMIDIERNVTSRFTSDAAIEQVPLWTIDGESVVFSSNRKGALDLYIKNAGGATPERPLFESAQDKNATAFSPDGKLLVFNVGRSPDRQIWALPLEGGAKPYRLLPDESGEHANARFSPDGKWLAYDAGNPSNVFVQPFPATGYREQISATRGGNPRWTADGRQIAFSGPDRSIMIADVTPSGGKLRVSAPRQLFQQRQLPGAPGFNMDGRAERFLLVVPPELTSGVSEAPLTVVVNWPSLAIKK